MKKYAKKGKSKKYINPKFLKLKKWIVTLFCILYLLSLDGLCANDKIPNWQRSDAGINDAVIVSVGSVGNIIFASSTNSLYKSEDAGETWHRIFLLRNGYINEITTYLNNQELVYMATTDGLYISTNSGLDWKRAFQGKNSYQKNIRDIIIDKDNSDYVIIGTERGLFISYDRGANWSAENAFLNKKIVSLTQGDNGNYVCGVDGVYYQAKSKHLWERIYTAGSYEEQNSDDYTDNGDIDTEDKISSLNDILFYKNNIYIATDDGLFRYSEEYNELGKFTSEGLLSEKIKFVANLNSLLVIGTEKGVYKYNIIENRWRDFSDGLPTYEINALAYLEEGKNILAATNKGLFRITLEKIGVQYQDGKYIDFSNEPNINEIQIAAINYAEVSNKKIEWMRNAAKKRAWLPTVAFGIDRDIDRTIDLDRGGTGDPDIYIEGPDEKGWSWDVGLSWDLGDMVWSTDQTSIDVRSRLMVQLRNDIIDQVTKLYFERRRLQLELIQNSIEDQNKLVLKQLRLEELTADIDGLTGSYLSDSLK